jgi:hypothetical protein
MVIKQLFFNFETFHHSPNNKRAVNPCVTRPILHNHHELVQVLRTQPTLPQTNQYVGNVKKNRFQFENMKSSKIDA